MTSFLGGFASHFNATDLSEAITIMSQLHEICKTQPVKQEPLLVAKQEKILKLSSAIKASVDAGYITLEQAQDAERKAREAIKSNRSAKQS